MNTPLKNKKTPLGRWVSTLYHTRSGGVRNIFELNRTDLWWLEDKFKRYNQLDKEIAVRKEELKIKKHDENVGGGRSNLTSSPVENKVIKELSDEYITTRHKWKKGIEEVYEDCTEEEQSVLDDKFWSDQDYLSWEEVGKMNHMSKTKVYDVRYSILHRFAKKIGYI